MPLCGMVSKIFLIADEKHIAFALLAMATIRGIGLRKSTPKLRARVAQQTSDIGFLIPRHRGSSKWHSSHYYSCLYFTLCEKVTERCSMLLYIVRGLQ
jgi:hypothetical protein